jgi:hypothetical protein
VTTPKSTGVTTPKSQQSDHGAFLQAAGQLVDLFERTETLASRPGSGILIQIGSVLLAVVIAARLFPFQRYMIENFTGTDFLVCFLVTIALIVMGAGLKFYDAMLSERRLEKMIDFQLEILRIERGISEERVKQAVEDQKSVVSELTKAFIAGRKEV